jgi:hypothetical protein
MLRSRKFKVSGHLILWTAALPRYRTQKWESTIGVLSENKLLLRKLDVAMSSYIIEHISVATVVTEFGQSQTTTHHADHPARKFFTSMAGNLIVR